MSTTATSRPHDGRCLRPGVCSNRRDVAHFDGYVGTERIWYLRVFRGVSMTPNLVLKLSRDFLGRYFVLGLMFFGPFWVYAISVVLLLHRARLPLWYWVGGYFIVMAADFALTFVTPALAYSTRKATAAARIGIGMMNLHFAK